MAARPARETADVAELARAARANALENAGIGYLYAGDPVPEIEALRKSIALDHQIGPTADDTNATIAPGSALFQTGKPHEARLLMETILPTLAAATPPRPWRRATASFTLARARLAELRAWRQRHP